MASSSISFALLFMFTIISNGQALTKDSQPNPERKINPLVIAPILNNTFSTDKSQAKNYTWTNSSEIHKEDLLNVIENNNIKVEYKETNIIPKLSNKIVINPIADNSVIYSLNNSIDKDKWSKEDDSLELLIVPSTDNDFLGDDNHYDSENNKMPTKIVDFLSKPEKNNNPSNKLKEKIKGKSKSGVTKELLLVIPSIPNNKTNNNTTANIDKAQKKTESLVKVEMKKDFKNVTEKLNTQTTNIVNVKTTQTVPINKNIVLIKVNRTNINDSFPEGNSSKNLSNNFTFLDKKSNIPSKSEEKEKDDIDGEITFQNSAVNKRVSKQETNIRNEIEDIGIVSKDWVMQESKKYESFNYTNSHPYRKVKRELEIKLPLPPVFGLLEPFNKKASSKPKASRDFSDFMELEPIILDNKF